MALEAAQRQAEKRTNVTQDVRTARKSNGSLGDVRCRRRSRGRARRSRGSRWRPPPEGPSRDRRPPRPIAHGAKIDGQVDFLGQRMNGSTAEDFTACTADTGYPCLCSEHRDQAP